MFLTYRNYRIHSLSRPRKQPSLLAAKDVSLREARKDRLFALACYFLVNVGDKSWMLTSTM